MTTSNSQEPGAKSQRLAILGLDCAEPSLVFEQFRPQLPVLSALMNSGMWRRLRSCDPAITAPRGW
ncbi:MAG TPA: hypothetical protein VEJ63_05160 [Planctomycetota bacterium]|nr:hypothetical protein [Planctomycetota bacterium]